MNATQSNKLRSYQTVQAVLEEHEETWKTLPAFEAGVDELEGIIPQINSQAQTQASRIGAAQEKAYAPEGLGNAAYEVAAAVRAYATANEDHELAGRVDFSRSDVTDGREFEVATRCRDILEAATAHIDSLADYGVNQAKLNALKKKIETFDGLQARPRQVIATSSAATKTLPKLFGKVDVVLGKRLDGLIVQFKDSAPDFYNAYRSARSIVDNPGGRNGNGNGNGDGTPTPTPGP